MVSLDTMKLASLIKFLFVALFFSFCRESGAQSVDSILVTLQKSHSLKPSLLRDSIQAHAYNYLAEFYAGGNDEFSASYIDSLDLLVQQTEWPKAQGLHLRATGKYHDRRGDFENALEYYSRAIESFTQAGDQSDYLAYTCILKAFVLSNNGLAHEAEKTLEDIRPLATKLSNKNFLAWIIDWYGDRYFYSGFGIQDFPKALSYYVQVEQLLPQVKNQMIKARSEDHTSISP